MTPFVHRKSAAWAPYRLSTITCSSDEKTPSSLQSLRRSISIRSVLLAARPCLLPRRMRAWPRCGRTGGSCRYGTEAQGCESCTGSPQGLCLRAPAAFIRSRCCEAALVSPMTAAQITCAGLFSSPPSTPWPPQGALEPWQILDVVKAFKCLQILDLNM